MERAWLGKRFYDELGAIWSSSEQGEKVPAIYVIARGQTGGLETQRGRSPCWMAHSGAMTSERASRLSIQVAAAFDAYPHGYTRITRARGMICSVRSPRINPIYSSTIFTRSIS